MKHLYGFKLCLLLFVFLLLISVTSLRSQVPTTITNGFCTGIAADFNSNHNGYNSPSIYSGIFDSSFYYHGGRGYWIDYLPPFRVVAPGFPRVMSLISPPYNNPNPVGSFEVGFYYVVNNPLVDRFLVRIISVTTGSGGTVTNVEATTGLQTFNQWTVPGSSSPYIDGTTTPVPDPTPFLIGTQGRVCLRLIDPDITNTPGTTYRVEVTYLITNPFFAVVDNISIGPLNSPLPVDFIGLVAKRINSEQAELRWDVSNEVNLKEYQIEYSYTGNAFMHAGTVNATDRSVYSFIDTHAGKGTVFYRVKSVDIDGGAKYSGIIRLKGNDSYGNQLMAYPVPAKEQVTIEHKKISANAYLTITSASGVMIREIRPATGSSHTMISLGGLSAGVYFLRLYDGDDNFTTTKLIKE